MKEYTYARGSESLEDGVGACSSPVPASLVVRKYLD